jgi:hypothetical protein
LAYGNETPGAAAIAGAQGAAERCARFCALTYPVSNIGDEIQTLAALQYLPDDHAGLVAREWLHNNRWAGPLKLILNGWFLHADGNWPPAPHFDPLIVSFHAVPWKPLVLSGAGLDWLRAQAAIRPIGARDLATLSLLQERDVPAYFSGCLTLTLALEGAAQRGDTIHAVDLDADELAQLVRMTDRPVVQGGHIETATTAPWDRLRLAEAKLRSYRDAAAIVTTRLHAALPGIALGTPVLMIVRDAKDSRFSGLLDHVHRVSREDFLAGRVDFDLASPPPNPEGWRERAAALQAACENFTGLVRRPVNLAASGRRFR